MRNPDKEIDDYVESFLRNQGRYEEVDTVEGDEIIDGDLVQVNEDGQAVDNGLRIVDTFLYLYLIKDEADKEIFKSAKVGDSFIFDIKKTFPDEKIQRTILQLNDNNKTELPSLFQITVKKIRRFIKAELSTELFNRKFGEGNVTNENEFREKMKEELMNSFKYDIDYKLFNDIKDLMLKKVDIKLPENHLRRWLKYVNKEVTDEQIEKEFPLFEKSLKWQIIQSKFVAQNNLEAKTDEIIEFAKENVRYQYKLYGFDHVSDEDVTPHAMELLKQNDFIKRAISNILEKKVVDIIKQNIKIDIEKISSEKFYEMLKNGNK